MREKSALVLLKMPPRPSLLSVDFRSTSESKENLDITLTQTQELGLHQSNKLERVICGVLHLCYLGITSSRVTFLICFLHSWTLLLLRSLVRSESGTFDSNDDMMNMLSESPSYGTSITSYSTPSFVTNSPRWRVI